MGVKVSRIRRIWRFVIIMILSGMAVPAFSSCGLNWTVPSNHFNGVNEHGVVSYWEEIDAVDLGGELRLPLIINFRSDRDSASHYLANGWLLALLESHIYQLNERNFVMVQPDGLTRYFYRINPQDVVLKDRGGWAAEIKGEIIVAWAECGWKLVFKHGRLVSMQTPKNRRLDLVQARGRVVELREGGRTHLKVVFDPSTGLTLGLEFNNRRIGIELDTRPIIQNVSGQNLVRGTTLSLHRITGLPGGPREYQFALDKKFQPTLEIGKPPGRLFTWNPATRQIVSDTGWSYTIQLGKGPFSYAAIERTNARGGKEFWHDDREHGIETEQSLNGLKKVTTYFASGQLTGKLRRVEAVAKGQTLILRDLAYNEKGQLIREMDADGVITTFTYNNFSNLTEVLRDGRPFFRRSYDDRNRVTEEEIFGLDKVTYRYLANDGFEKTIVSPNGDIAKLVYDRTNRLVGGSFSNGSGLVLNSENAPTIIPATSEKRDALIGALTSDLDKLKDPIGRGNLLIRIGRIYTDCSLGPSDPHSAIKVFEAILIDPTMDDYLKGMAYSWITDMYIEIGRSNWPKGVEHLKRLLALKGDGLTPERLKKLRGEQNEGFRKMLALMQSGQPRKDEQLWRKAFIEHGSSKDFEEQLNRLLSDQKKQFFIQNLSTR